jgi:hypothetical protein
VTDVIDQCGNNSLYDVDVAVIGNGPAGIAAAIRARWVKGYSAFPSSVKIIGAGPVGGLLPWGGALLTGPGWAFKGEELLEHLTADLERFKIPVIEGSVFSVRREAPFWVIEGEGFSPQRALSVVIASGFRAVGDEADYFQKGVYITFKGYDYFPKIINEAISSCDKQGLLVAGNERTELLIPIFEGVRERAGGLVFLLDAEFPIDPEPDFDGEVVYGKIVATSKTRAIGSDKECFKITAETPGGDQLDLACGAVLLDYNAFEHKPSPLPRQAHRDASRNALLRLERDERGFLLTDRWMATSEPGIFAAGDITGRYSSTLMALGDGVCAGFSAYRWAYKAKFGREPRLFAYSPSDEVIRPGSSDMPAIPAWARPKLLGGEEELAAMAGRAGLRLNGHNGSELFDGKKTLREIASALDCNEAGLASLVTAAGSARLMTAHVIWSENISGTDDVIHSAGPRLGGEIL